MSGYAQAQLSRQRVRDTLDWEPIYAPFHCSPGARLAINWAKWPIGKYLIKNRSRLKPQGIKWQRHSGLKEVSNG